MHSLRAAALTEMRLGGVDKRIRQWMAWWRGSDRTADGYESISLGELETAVRGYGSSLLVQVTPGVVSAPVSLADIKWNDKSVHCQTYHTLRPFTGSIPSLRAGGLEVRSCGPFVEFLSLSLH